MECKINDLRMEQDLACFVVADQFFHELALA